MVVVEPDTRGVRQGSDGPPGWAWVVAGLFFAIVGLTGVFYVFQAANRSAVIMTFRNEERTYVQPLEAFRSDCGRYPTTKEGMKALVQRPHGLQSWHGPYLKGLSSGDVAPGFNYKSPTEKGSDTFRISSPAQLGEIVSLDSDGTTSRQAAASAGR
ncbi:MAG TPA: type II secretion system protein GspG [Fimbriimonas sp.]|nr:type II secretion system protein GspG [Fimbriimonas sp.]